MSKYLLDTNFFIGGDNFLPKTYRLGREFWDKIDGFDTSTADHFSCKQVYDEITKEPLKTWKRSKKNYLFKMDLLSDSNVLAEASRILNKIPEFIRKNEEVEKHLLKTDIYLIAYAKITPNIILVSNDYFLLKGKDDAGNEYKKPNGGYYSLLDPEFFDIKSRVIGTKEFLPIIFP
ncbi:MAG: DUF4411 family protein [Hydrotalea sp.]|nr:DUF4411 family protein [Hydrotalea sp.]